LFDRPKHTTGCSANEEEGEEEEEEDTLFFKCKLFSKVHKVRKSCFDRSPMKFFLKCLSKAYLTTWDIIRACQACALPLIETVVITL
jgi:hypothetical protein